MPGEAIIAMTTIRTIDLREELEKQEAYRDMLVKCRQWFWNLQRFHEADDISKLIGDVIPTEHEAQA